MTQPRDRGVDTPAPARHPFARPMIRAAARFFFAFAGYFAPRNPGGRLQA